ncbi:uncharacterized protein [Euwallacea similis]|uniref:uncharacterized protein n=1 Tax=Euwallacea similis TaxID=1736056 RepID=UPI00344BB821
MSPASLDALEIERYIGACLFSQNHPKNFTKDRDSFPRSPVYSQNGFVNFQNGPSAERWAGGAPLISFAGCHRGNRRQNHDETSANHHLAQLAVHTQGAPLILTKYYHHRKHRANKSGNVVQQTKIFENSNNRKPCPDSVSEGSSNSIKGVDSVSVTSDESSASQNSETCLPRIIKPRKRRKKDRKPLPHINRSHHLNQSGDNTNIPDQTSLANLSPYFPYFEPFELFQNSHVNDEASSTQTFDFLGEISETPKLHHSFEEVEEGQDVNGNQPVSTCQCRYCDPEGQIWDVDRSCYSPFLTPPKSFDFSSLFSSFSSQPSIYDNLQSQLAELSLNDDDKHKPPFSRSTSSSSSSSFSSSGDLEVSTEIVTSPNGHRDLEIKFWLSGSVDSKSATRNSGNSG